MSMNLDELRRIRDTILENPHIEQLVQNVAHVISYLMSEQEKRQALSNAMEKLTQRLEAVDKLTYEIAAMKERSMRNTKLLGTVLTSVLSIVALELLKLVFK